MADEKIVTNVVATSDFSGLIADVQRTTSALSKLQAELSLSNKALAAQAGQIQKSFGETLRSTGQFTTHFVTVGSEVETFGKKLDAGKLKLGDYFRTWQTHTKTSGGLIRDLAKQQVALQNAIVQPLGKAADGMMKFNVHVANGIDETVSKTALARKELQIYNKVIQDGGVQLINWGKNTQWAGRQLTVGLTVPLAAFGAASAKAFREADQELVRLQKVYGGLAETSSQELAKVRKDVSDTARELAGMYGASFKDTIALAADIAATGKQGNELLKSTREATRLSILGEVDRQEAMKATLAIQSAFKQNTEELTESINFLNAVENQTSTSLADLVEAIPKAGPVVKALGGDVQDLALYLTAMREGGVNASEGANALKSALASIINPTKVAKEQFLGFGIDLEGIVNKNAGNLTQTILSIQSALDALDPLKKSQAIEQLFGKFQFARMNALFENLGKQGSQTLQVLDLMKASSQDLANVAGRELAQITESASGQYKRAIESLKASLAGLGEQFLEIGTFFIKIVDGVIKFATKLPDPVKNLLGLLGGITALAGPLIMLTGVFANFIGYVIKGIGHLRALGRGGEGFKLLTPQILAAEQAGSLIEQTFYSDAQAAKILSAALANLSNEYTILQQKAVAGTVSAQPLISTIAGNVVMEGSGRVADPTSPYIGKPYSRQMSHTRPVAGMTTEEKSAQNIFGVVPGPAPVNQRIGKNPQIYMTGELPRVPGITEIGKVSTGIVADEAAKWHSMTAALAMQSQEEIALLKKEVAATGAVTTELSTSYQALLPKMTNITTLAAEQSRLIVADLEASKITVDQARAKVIQLNARIEAMMAETAASVAASQGRTVNLGAVPLTGQPVVDPVTGKSNMKEMFHKSKTSALVDKIARGLGVRTSGGGYSIETTKPRRLNAGGDVFYNNGDQVPGPNVNADVVPAMLTPGEFVIRRDIAQQDPDGMRALNAGQAKIVPVQGRNLGGLIARLTPRGRKLLSTPEIQKNWRSVFGKHGSAPKSEYEPKGNAGVFGGHAQSRNFSASTAKINKDMETIGVDPQVLLASINARGGGARTSTDVFLSGLAQSGIISKQEYRKISKKAFSAYAKRILGMEKVSDNNNPMWSVSNEILLKEFSNNPDALAFWQEYSRQPGGFADAKYRSSSNFLNKLTLNGKTANFANLESSGSNKFYHTKEEANPFIAKLNSYFTANSGGMIPGYRVGGRIPGLPKNVIERLTSRWPGKKQFYPQGHQYRLGNQDPLHGPLQIGMSQNLKSFAGYDPTKYPRESILYRDQFSRMTTAPAFLTGDEQRRGMYSTSRYMAGDLDIMSQMETLGNHPLGPIAAMKAIQQKFSGKLYRGILAGQTQNALPKHIEKAILQAKETGDWNKLLGKEFIMRRSSWSKDKMIANYFAKRGSDPGSILLEAAVRNRNIVPAGDLFPKRVFRAPYGQDYPTGKFGGGLERPEQEAIFGGKFKIVGYKNGALQIETIAEARAMGGPVNAGQPYIVGEKGPELFVPRNSGGIIPNNKMQRFEDGGVVKPASGLVSTVGAVGGSIGGGMIGQSIAGPIGGMVGSIAGGFLPQLLQMLKSREFLTAAQIFTKTNVAIGATVGALTLAYKAYKNYNDQLKTQALGFALTSEAAAKAGLNYKDLNLTLKEAIKNNEALAEKNRLVYASITSAGTPLKLTIEEYRKLKEEVKSTMPELVKLVNQTKSRDVGDLAIRLKTMFMQAGDAADEATKKTFALIAASNKVGLAGSAIGSKDFGSIQSLETAAAFSVRSFTQAEATGNSQASYAALQSAINGINAGIDEIMRKSKDNLTYQEATAQQFEKINSLAGDQARLSNSTLTEVQKQMPELGRVLNSTDSIRSVWQKYQLLIQGTTVDLSVLSDAGVDALYKMNAVIEKSITSNLKSGQLKSTYDLLDNLQERQKKLERSSAGISAKQQIDSRKQIESLQKQIKLIQEEADTRKKALQERQRTENFTLSIQKKQIEYQDALAAGDMSRAAQAQLDIKSMSGERQTELAVSSIEKNAELRIEPLQKQIDALNEKNQKLSDSTSLAGDALDKLTPKVNSLASAVNSFKGLLEAVEKGKAAGQKIPASDYAALYQLFKDIQKENPALTLPAGVKTTKTSILTGQQLQLSPAEIGKQLAESFKVALTSKEYFDSQSKFMSDLLAGTNAKKPPFPTERPKSEQSSAQKKRELEDKFRGPIVRWGGGIAKKGMLHSFGEQGKEYGIPTTDMMILNNFQSKNLDAKFKLPNMAYSVNNQQKMSGGQDSYTVNNYITGTDLNVEQLSEAITRKTIATIKDMKYNNKVTNGSPGARLI